MSGQNRPDGRPGGRPVRASREHLWLAPLGLVLVGAGVSTAVDAAQRRRDGAGTVAWAGQGTVGLVLLNSGICVVGDAVRRRAVALARG